MILFTESFLEGLSILTAAEPVVYILSFVVFAFVLLIIKRLAR